MIELEIVTPKERVLKVLCESVMLPGVLGEFEVLEGHAPLLSLLKSGSAAYKLSPTSERLPMTIGEGFAQVDQSHVTVLCESADLP